MLMREVFSWGGGKTLTQQLVRICNIYYDMMTTCVIFLIASLDEK